jgi:hypothetical protein
MSESNKIYLYHQQLHTDNEINENENCAICLEYFPKDKEIAELTCNPNHRFHEIWILKWFEVRKRCPLCNTLFKRAL